MLRIVKAGLFSLIAFSLPAVSFAQAPSAPAAGAGAAQEGGALGLPAAGRAPVIPGATDVLATVTNGNQSDKITKGEVVAFLSHYPAPRAEDRETIFREAIEHLVNTKLLTEFLSRQKIPAAPEKVEEEVERLKQQLKAEGQDMLAALSQSGISLDDVKKTIEERIRWSEYVKSKATDAALRKYVADNRDLFSGTQVRASHIMLKVDPNASAADKEKVKQKLAGIRNDIDQRKYTFAEAANKFSEDPANAGGAGGDLDYFSLSTGYIEEFTDVAFKLRKGMISEPVETPFGYHLIQVTDRKEGMPVDFDKNKPYIMQAYGGELQKTIVAAERKNAKVDVKPVPKDLFPQEPPPAATGATGEPAAKTKVEGAATPKS
jgi:parvulin-like peptidyl-prolyl isomerase